jgi:hypothetical protein
VIPIQLTKAVVENGSDVGLFSPSQYTSAPSAISAGYLPIRIRKPHWNSTKGRRGRMGRLGRGGGKVKGKQERREETKVAKEWFACGVAVIQSNRLVHRQTINLKNSLPMVGICALPLTTS